MNQSIAHVAFNVSDMEKSLDFYCRVLKFEKAFEMAHYETGEPWIVYLAVGNGQFIELFYGATEESEVTNERIGYSHICIQVEDINNVAQQVTSAGVELDRPVKFGVDNNWQCWVRDPDRNRIEFMQISSESPQAKFLASRG